MVERDRLDVLHDLVALSQPVEELHGELSRFEWDSGRELVVLQREHVTSVLKRFLIGSLTRANVEAWANAIEGRDDIGHDELDAEYLRQIVFALANPELEGALTMARAKALLKDLDEDAS